MWFGNLASDMCAGFTMGFMIMPQSMSYDKLAGLQLKYGLYIALFPKYAHIFLKVATKHALLISLAIHMWCFLI